MSDKIILQDISVKTRIGVPDQERKFPQTLLISITLHQSLRKAGRTDSIDKTIDYYSVYQDIHTLAALKPRKLIEHLTHEIAEMILKDYAVNAVEVEIKKFILPETSHVGVKIKRKRSKT